MRAMEGGPLGWEKTRIRVSRKCVVVETLSYEARQ